MQSLAAGLGLVLMLVPAIAGDSPAGLVLVGAGIACWLAAIFVLED